MEHTTFAWGTNAECYNVHETLCSVSIALLSSNND